MVQQLDEQVKQQNIMLGNPREGIVEIVQRNEIPLETLFPPLDWD
jgi:hypothetical protein